MYGLDDDEEEEKEETVDFSCRFNIKQAYSKTTTDFGSWNVNFVKDVFWMNLLFIINNIVEKTLTTLEWSELNMTAEWQAK